MRKKIPFFSLVILIIATIDSIRNLPSSALFGSSVIFFFIFSALVFLIPTALVAAELSATFPEKGGIYYWVKQAFGEKMALVALWLQWANTMVWYPSILSFIAGTVSYLFDPSLASSPAFILPLVLTLFWGLTFLNLFGLHTSVKVNEICGMIGTIFPMFLLIGLGILWFVKGHPIQIQFNSDQIFPTLSNSSTWISLISIMAGFLGMELSGVHITEMHNPQRNFPRAILLASSFILFSMLFGSLAIAIVLPNDQISLVAGVVAVFSQFFQAFGITWCMPIITLLIVIGNFGTMINWLLAPAKGFLHATEFGFLPKYFAKTNKFGAPSAILITQAVLVSLFCMVFFLVPGVNAFYWFLTALSTSLYMMMYILMFASALFLHYRYLNRPKVFKIPMGTFGICLTVFLGLIGCLLTIFVGFFPPDAIHIASKARYAIMIGSANLIILSPIPILFLYKQLKAA